MTSSPGVVAILWGICALLTLAVAAPATYDERQEGELNVRAKLENIMIVVALPSKPVINDAINSEISGYLTMLAAAQAMHLNSPQDEGAADTTSAGSTEPSKAEESNQSHEVEDDDDLLGLFSADDEDSKGLQHRPEKSSEKAEAGEKPSGPRPKARNLWGRVEDVVHNRQGASLKKELSWGQDEDAVLPAEGLDEHSRSSDHNEVGLITKGHLTLVGGNAEDCGPDRVRNSYGICQALPSK